MGGSRKGEQRGGARPGRGRTTKVVTKAKGAVIAPAKPPRHKHLVALAQEREMLEIITGLKMADQPTDTQLENMHAFQTKARQFAKQAVRLILMEPRNAKHRREIEAELALCEMREREYRILASQVARDAAPFHHPRLSAIAVHQRGSSVDLFDLLLQEIDEQPRMRVIEHRKKDEEAA